jgi:hypothetical protein
VTSRTVLTSASGGLLILAVFVEDQLAALPLLLLSA